MGKRIEDLNLLPDGDVGGDLFPEIPDERDMPWYRFCGEIDALLATGEYGWAQTSLDGIRETVEKTHRVSDGQKRAVGNIEAAGQRKRADGIAQRRYEGFYGRRR